MLLNIETNKIHVNSDCLTCPYFDKKEKRCKGIGKRCFEYDPLTKRIFDPITHLPIKH